MAYPFPAISAVCPLCRRACGAVFRGYYRRWAVCPESQFMGWLAIRTGYCKALRRRFALFPSFLVPFRGFSRAAMLLVWQAWKSDASKLQESVDAWFFGLGREVYLSLWTLYSQLQFLTRQAQAGNALFGIPSFAPNSLCGLASLNAHDVELVILHPALGVVANSRIDPPP
jgi:hypothetical protein